MKYMQTALMVLFLAAGIFLFVQPVMAETQVQDKTVYQTSFTTDPQWTTNSPRSFYWVPEKGVYHYAIEASSGAYAYKEVDISSGPFTLEFDVTPQNTEDNSAFRFGLTGADMLRTKGTVALSEFTNSKGRLMWIRAVTPSNKLYEVSSYSFSYAEKSGGKTVNFADNTTYHVVLSYENERDTVTMRVTDKKTGSEIWGYFLNVNEPMKNMDRIALGPLGDFSAPGIVAEGYIDNVRLSTQVTVESTPATTATTAPPSQATTRITTKPTTKTTPPEQTTEQESPLSSATVFLSLGIIGAAAILGKTAKKW